MYGVYFFSRTSYLMFTISAALSISAPLNEVPGSRLKFRLSIYVSVSSFPAVHDRSKLEVHQTQSDLHLHTPYASVIHGTTPWRGPVRAQLLSLIHILISIQTPALLQ